jgi:hypothetical protein
VFAAFDHSRADDGHLPGYGSLSLLSQDTGLRGEEAVETRRRGYGSAMPHAVEDKLKKLPPPPETKSRTLGPMGILVSHSSTLHHHNPCGRQWGMHARFQRLSSSQRECAFGFDVYLQISRLDVSKLATHGAKTLGIQAVAHGKLEFSNPRRFSVQMCKRVSHSRLQDRYGTAQQQ